MLEQLSAHGLNNITLFLKKREGTVEHYAADHAAESIIWVDNQQPDSLYGLPETQKRNLLKEEYWTHMENFPGVKHVDETNIQHLKDVLSSLAVDARTSDGSTSPFSAEQIQSFLIHLGAFGEGPSEYQTYTAARLWNMIWHARTVNRYGGPNACLDRLSVLLESTPRFTGGNFVLAGLMLGAAGPHLSRCSRAWAGRVAYVTEWGTFKTKNEKEWRKTSELVSFQMAL
ncbi:hypothetical protein FS749_008203 [Ceratobasidium sp. UAMH 11750]|nr:hypothetical protein FS749_008203 [Ceratobasidium sp. UAMH 11750]